MLLPLLAIGAAWEGSWWLIRKRRRVLMYEKARLLARRLNRPLVVIGAPDRGPTAGAGCGDLVIDIGDSDAPNFMKADITKRLPIRDNSVVVYVSCVLEYVNDRQAAYNELLRIAGNKSRIFNVWVEPFTLAYRVSASPKG